MNENAQRLEIANNVLGKLVVLSNLDLDKLAEAAGVEAYLQTAGTQAERLRQDIDALQQQKAADEAAHARTRERARLDFEVEQRELRAEVAALVAERDRLEGELNDLTARRDAVHAAVEQMRQRFSA